MSERLNAFFPAEAIKLENGLSIIYHHIPATPVVVVDVWVKAGAVVEPDSWSGMAHFLEHMIFKGTERLVPGAFDRIIEGTGGMTNAATSHDYAHFFITTAAQYLEDTLPHLADLLLHPAIPDEEFDRERDVVLEEIRGCYDDPDWVGFQTLNESIYQCHSYGRSILGTEELLCQRSPEEMRSFHRFHYQPENMTVAIVGGVEKDYAIDLVKRSFSNFNPPGDCPLSVAEAEPPLTGIRRQDLYLSRLEQSRLLMAWIAPGVDRLKDAYGMDLLSALLAEGRVSRLVRELREDKQLVQHISSGFSLQRESSLFTISACLPAEYLDRVEAIIGDRISELQNYPVSETELRRCQRGLCNDYAFSTEAPSQLAGLYGYYNTIATAEVATTYPKRIQELTVTDIQRLAQQYLSPYRYAVVRVQSAE